MLYSNETKLLRRESYNFITALNRNINKVKNKETGRTTLSGKPIK
jgi:hypothetical protein